MGAEALPPAISPEDQFFINLSEGGSGNPPPTLPAAPAAVAPAVAPASGAAPAPATPAAAATPAAPSFPAAQPAAGFEFVEPEPAARPDPVAAVADAVAARIQPAPATPTAAAATEPKYVQNARAMLADPECSSEARQFAEGTLEMYAERLEEKRAYAELQTRMTQREQAEELQAVDAEQAALDQEFVDLQASYHITADEAKKIEAAWTRAVEADPRLASLTAEEAARRCFGAAAFEARRKPAGAAPGRPALAVVPGTGPSAGHLVSDASGGSPPARGGWTPPSERPPQLEDARRAAHAALNSR